MTIDEFAALARARRTNMQVVGDRQVPRELVEQLCELAQWAPNHKRTWPWRFCLVTDGREMFGNRIADTLAALGEDSLKVEKNRSKYLRTPALLVVGSAAGHTALRTAENRDAVAAGVQNILLGATAAGLASYWSSCPKGANEVVAQLCGFAPDTQIVAIVYLGWQADTPAIPVRPAVVLNTL